MTRKGYDHYNFDENKKNHTNPPRDDPNSPRGASRSNASVSKTAMVRHRFLVESHAAVWLRVVGISDAQQKYHRVRLDSR